MFFKARNKNKIISTKHGELKTPFFMPDATRGFVKFLANDELKKVGVKPMVVNTYHLYLQPGTELIKEAGGIHKFMNYQAPLLSDSGGYQVFSLIHQNPKMGKITDYGVIFRSPLDGSKHSITPEKSIQIQFDLGVDMMVCFDDPPPNFYSKDKVEKAVERTIAWAERCLIEYEKQINKRKISKEQRPLIFCVIQGGEHIDLRKKCAKGLRAVAKKIGRDWDGYGFGGRHIDTEGNFMEKVLKKTASFIPNNALKFALGIGTPRDIVKCVKMGWDMFDCVIPTREGRHGKLFVWKSEGKNFVDGDNDFYETVNITNEKFKKDFRPPESDCQCELCQNYSKAYLHHLFKMKDPLGMKLAAIHNLRFYSKLLKRLSDI